MKEITGDIGARELLLKNSANIWDVPINSSTIFTDFDTPDSLQQHNHSGNLHDQMP